jgi:hypothetical protein
MHSQEPISVPGYYDNVGGYEAWHDIYYPKLVAAHIIDENYILSLQRLLIHQYISLQ